MLVFRPQLFADRVFTIFFWTACLVVPFVSFSVAEAVSDAFTGQGAEIMGITLLLLHFMCLLAATVFSLSKSSTAWLMAIGAIALITYKGSSLILYLDIYSQQLAFRQPLIVGIVIGLGICVSLLVLFRFLLAELYSHHQYAWVTAFWVLYLAGNTAEISNLLLQINAVEWGAQTLFDMSAYIQDASEYGHLLKALIGFDASPTALFIAIYGGCVGVAILTILAKRMNTRRIQNRSAQAGTEVEI
jgi:high-affinity iron transporter